LKINDNFLPFLSAKETPVLLSLGILSQKLVILVTILQMFIRSFSRIISKHFA